MSVRDQNNPEGVKLRYIMYVVPFFAPYRFGNKLCVLVPELNVTPLTYDIHTLVSQIASKHPA